MGTWNATIFGNDSSCDTKDEFFERYNRGEDPSDIKDDLMPSINEIESIKIDYYIVNGRKYLIRFELRNGQSAGLLITYNIDYELERLKKELKINGFEI